MLYFMVTTHHDYTIRSFLSDWGKNLVDRVRIVHYKTFLKTGQLPRGSYIFSDLERISPDGLKQLQERWQALANSRLCPNLLNQPLEVKKRLDLLNKLKEVGINDFNAYPVTSGNRVVPEYFPVFIREANDHEGPYGELIHNQADLDKEIAHYTRIGKLDGCPIVTEFIDTSDSLGRYYKYSAFRVGKRIVPTHIHVNAHWMVKSSDSDPDRALIDEELEFIKDNPHEERLMEIFQIANIDYGRIDYALDNGRIQVFEINTNPVIMNPGEPKNPDRIRRKKRTAEILSQAFLEIDANRVQLQ
jgi:hypothetical protein